MNSLIMMMFDCKVIYVDNMTVKNLNGKLTHPRAGRTNERFTMEEYEKMTIVSLNRDKEAGETFLKLKTL